MAKELWTETEILEFFQIEEGFLRRLEEEEIVCPFREEGLSKRVFPVEEVEKLRVAKILVEEMDVNLSGVEVILQMRRTIIEMRRQFDSILEDLARQMGEALKRKMPPG
ncbi:MAG: hypothetical protein JRJ09_08140 [Deltaproteobacteria bacterium]|nr:hypothetical protein [Deltaproteobacteria bacterium]MBW2048483.1 hypothetical protein [Deltaproteobacteria bacterium]MBW2111069.1 hypothetical protein [Deltaproteobacteria bacterium]MBW2353031.1 hypothetical protein [Deltaproteobacteria bacterium]